jgi:hypothetical protein
MNNFHQTFAERIKNGRALSIDESFAFAKQCSLLLNSKEFEVAAREVVVRALESLHLLPPATRPIWESLIESAGLYQYLPPDRLTSGSAIRREFHRSRFLEETYFHAEQNEIAMSLSSGQSVILSAPTSFGKSLLIEEIVASNRYKNIVIIQPTLALLDETRKKLSKYRSSYKLIVSTSEAPSNRANIFLFTGERVVEYKHWWQVDFFIIDEFYKLSIDRDDERAVALNQAFHKLLKYTHSFYLLGPSVESVPDDFAKRIDFEWKRSEFATVALDEIELMDESHLTFEEKRQLLFGLIDSLIEPTLVYCSAPEKAVDLVKDLVRSDFEGSFDRTPELKEDVEKVTRWIRNNIHPDWVLCEALKKGVAFHHGGLPRHVGSTLVDLFNSGGINVLFCTSTLIEGVNTTAKNVVLFDQVKGRKPIDFFDFRNIAGRSGRMFKYFTGRLYRFAPAPSQYELKVDIPLFTQEKAPLDLLIQLDSNDVKPEVKHKLDKLNGIDPKLLEILRTNGINIEGQLAVVDHIERDISRLHPLLSWKRFPKYPQLLATIELGWNHLLRPNESRGGVRSARHLAVITMGYMILKSLGAIIQRDVNGAYWKSREPDPAERVNKVVSIVLNAARHWLDYKLPKWLGTISSLQAYVFQKHELVPGDYSYLAGQIEHGFLPPVLAVMLEYDVPSSALRKLQHRIGQQWTLDQLFDFLQRADLAAAGLDEYERGKIAQAVN